jgi:GNAT superfamily N-acetyltransferase
MPEPEGALNPVVPLNKAHEIADFDCGKAPLNEYLVKYALQSHAGGGARSYVLTRGNRVVGYYSLAPASVSPEDVPERMMKGQGRYPVPAVLMARFAVDQSEQRKGYGRALFRDAVRRALSGAEIIGGRVFLVHAKDSEARAFYLKRGLEESPTNPLHLLWLFKDIRKSLEDAAKL